MLLPSAFTCDMSQSPRAPVTRLQSAIHLASPPASPPQLSTQNAIGNIFTTCRSLQALLASPAPIADEPVTPPTSSHAQLPTPPMAHAPSPLKLRLRSHKTESAGLGVTAGDRPITRKRIIKRSVPARGQNKRRRALDDDMGRDDGEESDFEAHQPADKQDTTADNSTEAVQEVEDLPPRPQTPKRARVAPEVLPLGLERSDYHTLHAEGVFGGEEASKEGTDVVVAEDGEAWSTEDDRILVELVLEKLKLSKSEWQDCARSLGKDRGNVSRRWKSLMVNGDIGLKRNSRRGKIHGTWR